MKTIEPRLERVEAAGRHFAISLSSRLAGVYPADQSVRDSGVVSLRATMEEEAEAAGGDLYADLQVDIRSRLLRIGLAVGPSDLENAKNVAWTAAISALRTLREVKGA